MTHPHPALSKAPARTGDTLRVVAAMMFGALRAGARMLVGRRVRPAWARGFELLVEATRGSWSVMLDIGVVRWRNVGDRLSPLLTDGLEPRFVHHDGEPVAIDAAWLEAPDATDAVILYLHGGGYVFGSLRTHGTMMGLLTRAARARTLAVEYRRGPEHPMPAALEDALSAYRYLLAEGISPDRIVLAGDSAGGGLIIATLVALRDAGEPLPAAGVAICPWVDLDCSGASFRTNAAYDYVGEAHCRLAAAGYLAGADPKSPTASPLFADLSGLPPLLVQAGELEVLVDQIRDFTARAQAAGVDARLTVYPDMVHAWHILGASPDTRRALDEIGGFVRERASRPPAP